MIINYIPNYIIRSLIITIIIELIVGIIIGIRDKKDIANIILVNMLTNPFVTIVPILINIKYGLLYRNIIYYSLEIIVFFTEGIIYKKVLDYKKINFFIFSFILNISSFGIGEVVNHLL